MTVFDMISRIVFTFKFNLISNKIVSIEFLLILLKSN